jgi:hypothetical protein
MNKEFYLRSERVWVKVVRKEDKSFSFFIGYTGEVESFKQSTYSKTYMPTIKDAKEFAQTWLDDYK